MSDRSQTTEARHVSKTAKALSRHLECLLPEIVETDDDSDLFYEMCPDRAIAHLDV
jgi:hypothetical protein